MKTSLALTALAVVIVGSFALSAIPAESYRVRPGTPEFYSIDEDKDGKCDHTPLWMHGWKGHKHGKAYAHWNCPNKDVKGHGWGMKGDKMYPNLPDGGNGAWGGETK